LDFYFAASGRAQGKGKGQSKGKGGVKKDVLRLLRNVALGLLLAGRSTAAAGLLLISGLPSVAALCLLVAAIEEEEERALAGATNHISPGGGALAAQLIRNASASASASAAAVTVKARDFVTNVLMRSTVRREVSFEVAARGKQQQHQAESGSPQSEAEEGDLFNPPVCGAVSEEFRRAARELCSPSPSIGSSEGSLLAVLASPAARARSGAGAGAGSRLTALQAAELGRTKTPQIKKQAALLAATIITPKPAAPSSSTSTSRPTSAPVVTV
jgi:hypothetical protein